MDKRKEKAWQAAKINEAAKPPVDLPTPWTPKIETTSMFAARREVIFLLLPTGIILGLLLGLT